MNRYQQKVFFFDNGTALLCDIISEENDFIEACVVNGVWHMVINRKSGDVYSSKSKEDIGEHNFVGKKVIIDEIIVNLQSIRMFYQNTNFESITISDIIYWAEENRTNKTKQLELS